MHIIESGNVAAALGVQLAGAKVIAAYPITPQTPLTEKLSEFVEAGKLDAEYIPVESEHSAMAVCIAASTAGSRAFTATSANGLLYMHEQVHWAAGARLPIVMCVANRGVGAPWTVWNDHQDSISQRDTGWIQIYVNDHQQIIDTVIKAYALAEAVSIPVMVCYDGYLLSHTYMPFELPEKDQVEKFLPPFSPQFKLDPAKPANFNTVTLPDVRTNIHGQTGHGYMEIRALLQEDSRRALNVFSEQDKNYKAITGRGGSPLIETYAADDAEYIAVAMGSLSYQFKDVVDQLRAEGTKVGVMSVHMYRPFPDDAVREALAGAKGVIIFEKALSYGYAGPLAGDIRSALYSADTHPAISNYLLGLGGREIRTVDLVAALREACSEERTTIDNPAWIGLKL